MLRAICMGEMDFFLGSLAVRSQTPLSRKREAPMRKSLLWAFLAVNRVASEIEY